MGITVDSVHLSNRLFTVASYIPEHSRFADIGSDHAYLPCYVCLLDAKAQAIAGELNEGPFQSARQEVARRDLGDQIKVRKGNGLDIIHPGEVSTLVIAGMGGSLIRDILQQGIEKLYGVERIITQPNVDAKSIRRWFLEHGYQLADEALIEEDGHYYEVLVGDIGHPYQPYSKEIEKELLLGPYLLRKKTEAFINKWIYEWEKREKIIMQIRQATHPDEIRITQFSKEIEWIKEAVK